MKWLIASDLHGSAACCRRLLAAFEREGAERLLLLGDLLYHGPRNPLPEKYDPSAVAALLSPVKESILALRGNCDAAVDSLVLPFPLLAEHVLLDMGAQLVFATHGHVYSSDKLPPLQPGDILLHGHTHVPACEVRPGHIYMNPGSLSLPKEGSWQGYMTAQDGLFLWKDLDGNERMRHKL